MLFISGPSKPQHYCRSAFILNTVSTFFKEFSLFVKMFWLKQASSYTSFVNFTWVAFLINQKFNDRPLSSLKQSVWFTAILIKRMFLHDENNFCGKPISNNIESVFMKKNFWTKFLVLFMLIWGKSRVVSTSDGVLYAFLTVAVIIDKEDIILSESYTYVI